jgi:hypothetical protein
MEEFVKTQRLQGVFGSNERTTLIFCGQWLENGSNFMDDCNNRNITIKN